MFNHEIFIKFSVLFWTPFLKGCHTWKDQLQECSTYELGAETSAGDDGDRFLLSEETLDSILACLWH